MINKYTNKQRGLLAVIMAMVMVFAGAAFVAAEVDAQTSDDSDVLSGTVPNGVTWSGEILTLNEYDGPGYFKGPIERIVLSGNNTIRTVDAEWAIYTTSTTLSIESDGVDGADSLTIVVGDSTNYGIWINGDGTSSDNPAVIKGVTVNVSGGEKGIYAPHGNLTIGEDGVTTTVVASGTEHGIRMGGNGDKKLNVVGNTTVTAKITTGVGNLEPGQTGDEYSDTAYGIKAAEIDIGENSVVNTEGLFLINKAGTTVSSEIRGELFIDYNPNEGNENYEPGLVIVNKGTSGITNTMNIIGSLTLADGNVVFGSDKINGTFEIDGQLGLKDTINADVIITDGAYLAGNLTIPAGKTLTISSTGKLDMMNYDLVVEGTLVIEKKGLITSSIVSAGNSIELKYGGIIDNEGTIGDVNAVSITGGNQNGVIRMQGVSGVDIGIKKSGTVQDLTVSGDIDKVTGATIYQLTIMNVLVDEDLVIGKNVTFEATTSTVAKNATVENKGIMTITNGLVLDNGASIIISGPTDGEIHAIVGFVGDDNKIFATYSDTIDSSATAKTAEKVIDLASEAIGMTVSVIRYNAPVDTTTSAIKQGVMISGEMKAADKDVVSPITVTAFVDMFVDDVFVINENMILATYNCEFDLSKDGTIKVDDEGEFTGSYVGAKYSIKSDDDKVTEYYTSFDSAMQMIATTEDTTIYVSGAFDVGQSYTLDADQIIEITDSASITIGTDAVITVNEDAEIANSAIMKISGKVIVMDGGLFTPASTAYVVKKVEKETNTITYSGLAIAIKEAKSGETIDVVTSDEIDGSLTVPADVTLNVAESVELTVSGNVNIAEGGIIIMGDGSKLEVGTAGKDSTITVDGELDASEAKISGVGNVNLYSAGTTQIGTNDNVNVNAVSYNDGGDVVYTSLAAAIAYAEQNGINNVTVVGKFTDNTDVTSNGVNITIDNGAIVKLGEVTIKGATIFNNGTLTATISGLVGEGDAATEASVALTESMTDVKATTKVNAFGTDVYALDVDGVLGKSVEVVAGTVGFYTLNINEYNSASNPIITKLIIAEGATLIIDENVEIDGVDIEFVINGTVIVRDGGGLTLSNADADSGKVPAIKGALVLIDNSTVTMTSAKITGAVTVTEQDDKVNTLNISNVAVTVGTAITSLGATPTITGPVNLSANYLIAYAGSDLSGAKINYVSGETNIVSTTYSVNYVEYATVYAEKNAIGISIPITIDMIENIKGLDFDGVSTLTWKADGVSANSKKVGDVAAVNVDITPLEVKIVISVGTGISLYIDGVKYTSAEEFTVGTHDVKAVVDPGYKGDVTITFDGQTITSGQFTITTDMDGKNVVLSATGEITADSGTVIVEPSGEDDGMALTDILLIVLVVLIVIMAIIVALRMMRS